MWAPFRLRCIATCVLSGVVVWLGSSCGGSELSQIVLSLRGNQSTFEYCIPPARVALEVRKGGFCRFYWGRGLVVIPHSPRFARPRFLEFQTWG